MTMNQDNQTPGQGDGFTSGGEEFVFTEEKRPVNRNMMVLLLIAVVGSALIYAMYLRNKGSSSADDESTKAKSQQVAEFMQKGAEDLKALDATLQKMEQQVDGFTGDNGAYQVKTEDLKTNPFQFEKAADDTPVARGMPDDPKLAVERAAGKAEIQMITYATRGSSCIVNNKLCSEGDQITIERVAFTVKQIAPDFVLLQNKLGEFKVTVKGKGL